VEDNSVMWQLTNTKVESGGGDNTEKQPKWRESYRDDDGDFNKLGRSY
jgi:hypothetical protein